MPDATVVLSNPTPGTAVITRLASGQPVKPLVVVEGQQFSAISMDYTSLLNGGGEWSRVPFDAVNSLKTGSEFNVDARLARTFAFTQRIKGTVGFEAFNLLNRQQVTAVNAIAYYSVAPLPPGLIKGPQSGTMTPVPGLRELPRKPFRKESTGGAVSCLSVWCLSGAP
jgi:hypothetical protein